MGATVKRVPLALLAAATLLAAPPAQADKPPPSGLEQAGLLVSWPRTVIPGAMFRVNVRATRERLRTGRTFTIALVRVGARGRTIRTIARRRMRTGLFEARVPREQNRRYAAVLVVDGRRFRKSFPTGPPLRPGVEPATPPPAAGSAPQSATDALQTCQRRYTGTPGAAARPQRGTVARGETLVFIVENTGRACLMYGDGHAVERRRADGTWERVPLDEVWPRVGRSLPPGGTYEKRRAIPADWHPGRYRVIDSLSYDGARDANGGAPRLTVTAEFDVV